MRHTKYSPPNLEEQDSYMWDTAETVLKFFNPFWAVSGVMFVEKNPLN